MTKINTAALSGMQELLPEEQSIFNDLKFKLSEVYRQHGFLNIETPVIERSEILLAKAGGDTEKQIYKIIKTAETAKESNQALRFDHTVPLARYVVEHQNDLAFPFAVTQIGRNYRGERAQKGRFREFYQCDVDIIGREHLDISSDAKIIAVIYAGLQTFNLPAMKIRINNRKLVNAFMQSLGLEKLTTAISSIIDHAEKVSHEQTINALKELGISADKVTKIDQFIHTHGNFQSIFSSLQNILGDLSLLEEGLNELRTLSDILDLQGLTNAYEIDFMIVRGLDYYTGTVFEVCLDDYREIGSISGGGRYENLCSNFSERRFPGVGGSIGLTRLFYVLRQKQFIDATQLPKPIDYCILPISYAEFQSALHLAEQLRVKHFTVDVDLSSKKLGDKIKHAAKLSDHAIIVGESEAKNQKFQVKDLRSGELKSLEI